MKTRYFLLLMLLPFQGFCQEFTFNSYNDGGADWLMETKITIDQKEKLISIIQEGTVRTFKIYEETTNDDFIVHKCKSWYLLKGDTERDYSEKQDVLKFTEMWISPEGDIFIYKAEHYGTDKPYTVFSNKRI